MAFADHFSSISAKYAAYRPHYPDVLVDSLAKLAPAHHLAWDAGCGTGQLSVPLARVFERVIATDPSQAQLDAAERAPNVEYRCEPAEHASLADGSADLIVVAQSAHWFDFPAFVAECRRVGRPGTLVGLVSYGVPTIDDAAALATYRDAIAAHWPKGREHVENGYRDLVWPWPAIYAGAYTLIEFWTRDELVGYAGTWSATQRLIKAEGTAAIEAFATALKKTWPDGEKRAVLWPLVVKLAKIQ